MSRYPAVQRLGRRCGRLGKRLFGRALALVLPMRHGTVMESVTDVRRVLLVRANFRIGNILIASPLVYALRQRFPGARVDCLVGDTSERLLARLPFDRVHLISRRFVLRPWQFVALFGHLRRTHYDVAVEAGMGSFSGGLFTFLTGARHRVGCTGKGDRFLTVRLPRVSTAHVYEKPVAFAHLLGADCPDHPVYAVSAEEDACAGAVLRDVGCAPDGLFRPFVAVFVGGHQDKRWPAPQWLKVAQALAAADVCVLVFVGPEEMHFAARLRQGLAGRAAVIAPQPLRIFAALLSKATLMVTPDSGPMHLAAALGVPTIAVLQSERSRFYAPRRADDLVLVRPSAEEVVHAVTQHPRWPGHPVLLQPPELPGRALAHGVPEAS